MGTYSLKIALLKIIFTCRNLVYEIKVIYFPKVYSNILANSPLESVHKNLTSPKRLNHLARQFKFKSYLEIGVERGQTLEAIDIDIKYGVDPNPLFDHSVVPQGIVINRIKSDPFFVNYGDLKFDLIFIDGLHEAKQTYRDLINSFKILNEGGFILLDDVWPSDFASSVSDKTLSDYLKLKSGISHRRWNGDVFKVVEVVNILHKEIRLQIIGNGVDSHSQALLWKHNRNDEIIFNKKAISVMRSIKYSEIFNSISFPWSDWITEEQFLEIKNFKSYN